MTELDADLLRNVARAICSTTDLRPPGEVEPVFDQPDDLVWLRIEDRIHPAPRWALYERQARAAIEAMGGLAMAAALAAILDQVARGKGADDIVAERALDEIGRLARLGLSAASGEGHR